MRFPRVLIFYNPISGRGRAKRSAENLTVALTLAGRHVTCVEPRALDAPGGVSAAIQKHDAVIVVGGDGTLRSLLRALAANQRPFYFVPCGNESLFAREFGMRAEPQAVIAALAEGKISPRHYGLAGEEPFFHMATVGFDADVVADIARRRTGPLGHHGYVIPTIGALLRHRPPTLSLSADDQPVLSNQPGFLIIANTSAYALRLRFAPGASHESPLLSAYFYPLQNSRQFLYLCLRARLGGKSGPPCKTHWTASEFRVTVKENTAAVQADGDLVGTTPITISNAPDKVLVLTT